MPPVALLPLVIIMPPVEVVVHSVALLSLAAVVPHRCAARRRRVPPVNGRRCVPVNVAVLRSTILFKILLAID